MEQVDYYLITITPEKTTDLKYPPLYSSKVQIQEIVLKKLGEDKWFIYNKNTNTDKDWIDSIINCIGAATETRNIVLVTHNVQFTRDLLYKTFTDNGYQIGLNGALLKWNWFSTMIDFRERFYKDIPVEENTRIFPSLWEILANIPYTDKAALKEPDKKISLCEYEKIFSSHTLPEWEEKIKTLLKNQWYNKPINTGIRLNMPPVTYFVRCLPGMSSCKNLGDIALEVSNLLKTSAKHCDISLTNELQLIGSHLLCYGFIKSVYGKANSKKGSASTCNTEEDEDEEYTQNDWYNILREIEILLRQTGRIFNDEIIHAVLCAICNCYSYEFSYLTFSEKLVEKGETEKRREGLLFTPGEPVSYLPFNFSRDFASDMYNKFGYASSYEILVDYINITEYQNQNSKKKITAYKTKEVLSDDNIKKKREFIGKFAQARPDFHYFITIDLIEDILSKQEKMILQRFPLVYLSKDYSCLF